MKPSNTVWGRVLACCLAVGATLGLWAGGALAQTDEPGGWFDDSAPAPAPPPAADGVPPGAPDYSPPPADFQPAPPAAAPDAAPPAASENDVHAQQRAVEEFSPRLQPYGYWVDDARYGRVWVPSSSVVGTDFVPYSTGGHWELTPEDAWLWSSDYPFGGITFHYGRWVWATGGAWAWVPGYVYAPAWVDFRVGAAGYIGWSPLGPSYVWRNGMFLSVGLWRPAPVVYCPTQYVFVRTMPRYVVRDQVRVRSISAQTHVYRPTSYYGRGPAYLTRGPSPAEARIPARALPARRVIAQPQLSPLSGASQRTRLESSSLPANRGSNYSRPYDSYRGAPARPSAEARRPAPGPGWQGPANRGGERRSVPEGYRPAPEAYHPGPSRTAPVPVPRDHAGRQAYGAERAAVPPRATRPEPDPRAARRPQRRDNSSTGDSRNRGRER